MAPSSSFEQDLCSPEPAQDPPGECQGTQLDIKDEPFNEKGKLLLEEMRNCTANAPLMIDGKFKIGILPKPYFR